MLIGNTSLTSVRVITKNISIKKSDKNLSDMIKEVLEKSSKPLSASEIRIKLISNGLILENDKNYNVQKIYSKLYYGKSSGTMKKTKGGKFSLK